MSIQAPLLDFLMYRWLLPCYVAIYPILPFLMVNWDSAFRLTLVPEYWLRKTSLKIVAYCDLYHNKAYAFGVSVQTLKLHRNYNIIFT